MFFFILKNLFQIFISRVKEKAYRGDQYKKGDNFYITLYLTNNFIVVMVAFWLFLKTLHD